MKKLFLLGGIPLFCCAALVFAADETQRTFVNSVGTRLIRVEPGTFMMGWERGVHEGVTLKSSSPGWYHGTPKPPALWEGVRPGLVGAIFNNRDISDTRALKEIGQVNLDWSSSDAKEKRLWGKSVRWRGLVKAPLTGNVTFTVETNDKVQVFINQ